MLLREDKRELIVLARYRGMKVEAIADLLGIEVGTVKVRMHRAVKELREIFLGLSESSSWNTKSSIGSYPTASIASEADALDADVAAARRHRRARSRIPTGCVHGSMPSIDAVEHSRLRGAAEHVAAACPPGSARPRRSS